jgi:hypothetical protein
MDSRLRGNDGEDAGVTRSTPVVLGLTGDPCTDAPRPYPPERHGLTVM